MRLAAATRAHGEVTPRVPSTTAISMATPPAQAGTSNLRRSTSELVARHGNAGAAAIRKSSAIPMGVVILSK